MSKQAETPDSVVLSESHCNSKKRVVQMLFEVLVCAQILFCGTSCTLVCVVHKQRIDITDYWHVWAGKGGKIM